jgi:hypothetical protein
MPRPYRIDPRKAHDRAVKAAAARYAPRALIRSLAKATLTDAELAALAAILAASLAGKAAGGSEETAA